MKLPVGSKPPRIRMFFRYIGVLGVIVLGLTVLAIADSFGIWGWLGLFCIICLRLGCSDGTQVEVPKTTVKYADKHITGFPLPTKGYGCIEKMCK